MWTFGVEEGTLRSPRTGSLPVAPQVILHLDQGVPEDHPRPSLIKWLGDLAATCPVEQLLHLRGDHVCRELACPLPRHPTERLGDLCQLHVPLGLVAHLDPLPLPAPLWGMTQVYPQKPHEQPQKVVLSVKNKKPNVQCHKEG